MGARAARGDGAGSPAETVGDRLWLWGHPAGSHTRSVEQWGIAGDSTIEPVDAARGLGIDNVIMVRYDLEPQPPFGDYARSFTDLERVVWSIEGGGGDDLPAALALQRTLPNLQGLMMDDYFGRVPRPAMWLAENTAAFPVTLTLTLATPAPVARMELVQSDWRTGDYLSGDFAVDVPDGGPETWRQVATGSMPATRGASLLVDLPGETVTALRVRILNTQDTAGALSCGLRRVRLLAADGSELAGVAAVASSEYPGHPGSNVLGGDTQEEESTFSLRSLQRLRDRLSGLDRLLDLWVVLYTNELGLGFLQPHLDLCDVIALWTWRAEDLSKLEEEIDRLEGAAARKRKVLGIYMWDYGDHKPMPLEAMEHQCSLGLEWLRQGRIEGMVFLASCICDLGLEAVEWTRRFISEYGDLPL